MQEEKRLKEERRKKAKSDLEKYMLDHNKHVIELKTQNQQQKNKKYEGQDQVR